MDLHLTALFFYQGGELFQIISSGFISVISAGCTGSVGGQQAGLVHKGSAEDTRLRVLLLGVLTHLSLG